MSGRTCRRVVLDYTMDGRTDRLSCEVDEEPCDVCQARESEAGEVVEEDEEERELRQRETKVHILRGLAMDRAAQDQLRVTQLLADIEPASSSIQDFIDALEKDERQKLGGSRLQDRYEDYSKGQSDAPSAALLTNWMRRTR
jgi:hypothetical protein